MRAEGGSRIEWSDLPAGVRSSIEAVAGAPVRRALNQAGGFSPGLAARCSLADGREVFVKAVSPDRNEHACRIGRREIEVASVLPPSVPAPRLLGAHDDGHWVAVVFEAVDGRQPHEPWTLDDLDVVVDGLDALADVGTPAPDGLQPVADTLHGAFTGWRRFAAGDGPTDDLPDWVRTAIDDLAAVEDRWAAAASGSTLVHADVRADNVLLDRDGGVWFVDWPHAGVGAGFLDLLFLLPSVGLGGGPAPASLVAERSLFAGVDPDRVRTVLVALAGFFQRAALDPDPPGLPRLRAFQQAQADVALAWLHTMW